MISRLRPLELTTSFQERTYRIGETIDLAIELTPRMDCEIREGRIDLVVEERWTERSMMTYEKPILQTSGGARGGVTMQQIGTETVTKEIVKEHKEKYTHSSATFLEASRISVQRLARYPVEFRIEAEPPPHANEAKLSWWLQTVIDVAGARDIKPRTKVDIAV